MQSLNIYKQSIIMLSDSAFKLEPRKEVFVAGALALVGFYQLFALTRR